MICNLGDPMSLRHPVSHAWVSRTTHMIPHTHFSSTNMWQKSPLASLFSEMCEICEWVTSLIYSYVKESYHTYLWVTYVNESRHSYIHMWRSRLSHICVCEICEWVMSLIYSCVKESSHTYVCDMTHHIFHKKEKAAFQWEGTFGKTIQTSFHGSKRESPWLKKKREPISLEIQAF